ncbi:MAG: HAD-IC family P-type ATPase, partial [Anaerolineae bacterium]|nr:HAD-IC family P-type ATPase [Anaerolineae bacterium]
MAELQGLSSSEAAERKRQGKGNNIKLKTSRSYGDIIRSNVLNLINVILFSIGAVMVAIGRVGDAFTSVGLIFLNIIIGIYQEIRAKRQLDQIALLTRPKISVIRDGKEVSLDPADLVLGDLIVVRAGDQMVVDGQVVGDGKIEVDESLLTGEADLIPKAEGDEVLSGSFAVTGMAYYEATRVGADSYANKLTANARQYTVNRTPLQREIAFTLRLLMALAIFIGVLMIIATVISEVPFMRQVQMAAVIAGLVPNGLFFMVILAYALGALNIVRRGALVQQSNAIEALSNVTVLCTDKTGTLTANKIIFHDIYPVGTERAQVADVLGAFAHSAKSANKTSEAIAAALTGAKLPTADEVPFSSARKWSAVAFDQPTLRGSYVLGALEMLKPYLTVDEAAQQQLAEWSDNGLRVLVFGHNREVTRLHDTEGEIALPQLTLMGVISFSDELRPALKETLAEFVKNGIQLKVISGDNPQTVAALAKQAGMPGNLQYVSGTDLATMSEGEFRQAAVESSIFGRITPEQKEKLVDALKSAGHYVAMIGDGVNDVLSLKKADMGIAMESGSSATRAVADMILLNDSFQALPPAFTEGQRIVSGMKDILRLFMTRVISQALLIVAIAIIGLGFPLVPKHNSLMVFLTVGIPVIGLAVWARPRPLPRTSILKEIAHFTIPASITIFVFGLLVYLVTFIVVAQATVNVNVDPAFIQGFERYIGINWDISAPDQFALELGQSAAQTALNGFLVLAGLL